MLLFNSLLLSLVLILHQVNGYVHHSIMKHINHPDKCYLDTDKGPLIIKSEQLVRHPTKCENIYCGRQSWALIFTCSPKSIPSGCAFGDYININNDFPECCERDWDCNDII